MLLVTAIFATTVSTNPEAEDEPLRKKLKLEPQQEEEVVLNEGEVREIVFEDEDEDFDE